MKNIFFDTIVIGGGQSALACAYYLRREKLHFLLLDDQPKAGGAWNGTWDSLTLFSPAEFSSLPGWLMPKSDNHFPHRDEVVSYLDKYEERYQFPIKRPVKVLDVCKTDDGFEVKTSESTFFTRTVISATGTYQKPYIPQYPDQENFTGLQIHSSDYKSADSFADLKVLVVGGGNSGAQIMAEVSKVAQTKWVTLDEPQFLPDDVDGRVLFDQASAAYYAMKQGKTPETPKLSLANIVMVPPVKEARDRGALETVRPFQKFAKTGVVWEDGSSEPIDAVIWCTGFGYALDHLQSLKLIGEDGRVATTGTRATNCEGLWLVGYGGWTGYASATLIGVGRTARATASEIKEFLTVHH